MSPRPKISFSTRMVIIVSLFLLVMDGLLGGLLMARSAYKMKSIVQGKIMEISQSAASFLDGDEIKALTIDDKTNNTEPYKKAYDTLAKFKTNSIDNNAGLAFIYCVVELDNKLVFSVDPSDEPGGFLTEETIYTDAILKAFEGTAGFDDRSYVDRWGDLYSAYAPVFGKDGTVKAVVGVDVWASWYKKEIASNAIMIGVVTASTIALGVLATVFITRKMRKKLDILSREMNELQMDVHELIHDIHDPTYLPDVNKDYAEKEGKESLAVLRNQINDTKSVVKNYIEYAHKQAYIDVLTGLGNRNAYLLVIKDIKKKIQNGTYVNFAVVLFDINGLKGINDQFGHEVGDKAIMTTGSAVKELFGEDIAYRIGGDEIVVVYQNVYEDTITDKLAQVTSEIAKFSQKYQLPFELTLSNGYSFFNKSKDDRYEDVFNRADEQMYKAKTQFYEKHKGHKKRYD